MSQGRGGLCANGCHFQFRLRTSFGLFKALLLETAGPSDFFSLLFISFLFLFFIFGGKREEAQGEIHQRFPPLSAPDVRKLPSRRIDMQMPKHGHVGSLKGSRLSTDIPRYLMTRTSIHSVASSFIEDHESFLSCRCRIPVEFYEISTASWSIFRTVMMVFFNVYSIDIPRWRSCCRQVISVFLFRSLVNEKLTDNYPDQSLLKL